MRTNLKYCLRLKAELRRLNREISYLENNAAKLESDFLQSLARYDEVVDRRKVILVLIANTKKFGFIWW